MFDRFTPRARVVLIVAQDEARSFNHSFIGPEHLLLGLVQGDGVAAKAFGQLGVRLEEMRSRVAASVPPAKAHVKASRVPFSPQAKKALELSLREALRLGHNYIGTEHLALGVLKVLDVEGGAVLQSLGVGLDEVRALVLEVMPAGAPEDSPTRSPALVGAMKRAREAAGAGPMTTGQAVLAILADEDCQAAKTLEMLGVTEQSFKSQLSEVPVKGTTDAFPHPRTFEITLGQLTTTIDDPDLAAALGDLTPEQLQAALRRAFGTGDGQPGSGSKD